jgi:hypothetical protein
VTTRPETPHGARMPSLGLARYRPAGGARKRRPAAAVTLADVWEFAPGLIGALSLLAATSLTVGLTAAIEAGVDRGVVATCLVGLAATALGYTCLYRSVARRRIRRGRYSARLSARAAVLAATAPAAAFWFALGHRTAAEIGDWGYVVPTAQCLPALALLGWARRGPPPGNWSVDR